MPEITFILPHWIYWGGILAIPMVLFFIANKIPDRSHSPEISLPLSYFFLLISGFMGIHRLYLKSWWATIFIVLFIGIIYANHEARQVRNEHSIVRNDVKIAEFDINRAQEDNADAETIAALKANANDKQKTEKLLLARLNNWRDTSFFIAVTVFILLLLEIFLIPFSVRRARARLSQHTPARAPAQCSSPAPPIGNQFVKISGAINGFIGNFVSYWTVIAVFVFYYEVIARYIFNSPTIWAHESMYLLFGMQYILAGGFCLRENAHVRVDVLYLHLSSRARAICDLITSIFFFVFTIALLVTGWIFFYDSYQIQEASFTEWAIPHWPIKFALPLGGALIVMQGISHVLQNIVTLKESQ